MVGGKAPKAPQPNPFLVQAMMSRTQPITTLPSQMEPTAPPALSPAQLVDQGLGQEQQLASAGLNVDNSNPIFGQSAAQDYANKFFDYAIQPQMGGAAIQQYMRGALGDGTNMGNSTVGGAFLGTLASQGAKEAFFAGQDFRNSEINNLLNRRQSFFSNDVGLAQQQNALDINRSLGLNNDRTARLNMMNNAQSNAAGIYGNLMNAQLGADQFSNQQQMFMQAQRGQALGNLAGGLLGGAFGLGNTLLKGRMGGGGFMGGGGTYSPSKPFGSNSFMFDPYNY